MAAKSLSTPSAPASAIFDAIAKLPFDLRDAARFVHGTTRVTNALLEGASPKIAIITTEGFGDVIEMARGHRPRLYWVKERPRRRLVPRPFRFEVPERIRADGTIDRPLDEAALVEVLHKIQSAGVSGVAICFLHAYRNDVHEQRAAAIVSSMFPALAFSTSAQVVAEIGEYERFATTVLNVSVKPFLDTYLSTFEAALHTRAYGGSFAVMTSSGGTISAQAARRTPMQLALSGPAGGVAAAAYIATRAGVPNVITCDMGGTSTDVCLIKDGRPTMTNLGEIDGFPNKTFQIDINTIGAGGGSIAWIDVGGELCVGPQSAGSTPGPACYGRGGTAPTTTDAHLLVGHLDPDEALGGEVRPDLHAAQAALEALAPSLGGLRPERVAYGIIQLAIAKMTSAIKEISVARGHDPRDFALLPFGGAGPMHATALADELGMTKVLVPPVPGNLSALGFIVARSRHDLVHPLGVALDNEALDLIAHHLALLETEGRAKLGDEAVSATFERRIGMRIKGQAFDLQVAVETPPRDVETLSRLFREAYEARYAYMPALTTLEIVNCRLTALGPQESLKVAPESAEIVRPTTKRPIYARDGWVEATIVDRAAITSAENLQGPLIVRESGATTVVGAGWQARLDHLGNLILTCRAA